MYCGAKNFTYICIINKLNRKAMLRLEKQYNKFRLWLNKNQLYIQNISGMIPQYPGIEDDLCDLRFMDLSNRANFIYANFMLGYEFALKHHGYMSERYLHIGQILQNFHVYVDNGVLNFGLSKQHKEYINHILYLALKDLELCSVDTSVLSIESMPDINLATVSGSVDSYQSYFNDRVFTHDVHSSIRNKMRELSNKWVRIGYLHPINNFVTEDDVNDDLKLFIKWLHKLGIRVTKTNDFFNISTKNKMYFTSSFSEALSTDLFIEHSVKGVIDKIR